MLHATTPVELLRTAPRALDVGCQGTLRHPHGAHAVVHPARPEPPLSDLEAPPLPQKDARYRNSNIPAAETGRQAKRQGSSGSRVNGTDDHARTFPTCDGRTKKVVLFPMIPDSTQATDAQLRRCSRTRKPKGGGQHAQY